MKSPVFGFARNHPPDAALGVCHIPFAAWNDVNMGVFNGLAGRSAIVEPDVEPGQNILFSQQASRDRDLNPQFSLFRFCKVKNTADMTLGDDDGVAFRDRVGIRESQGVLSAQENTLRRQIAEWTFGASHEFSLSKTTHGSKRI